MSFLRNLSASSQDFFNDPEADAACAAYQSEDADIAEFFADTETDRELGAMDWNAFMDLPEEQAWGQLSHFGGEFTEEEIVDGYSESFATRKRKQLMQNQRGAGIGRQAPTFEVDTVFERERNIARFNRVYFESRYTVKHNFNDVDLFQHDKAIDNLFGAFVGTKLTKSSPGDYISMIISHHELFDEGTNQSRPIFINKRVSRFDTQEIFNRIFEISQSNSMFLVDGKLNVEIALTKSKEGTNFPSKRGRAPRTVDEEKVAKQSIVVIKNKDNACGYWAVALSRYHATKTSEPEWKALRQNKLNRLENLAKALCLESGLDYNTPLNTDNCNELDQILAPRFQLIVVDGSCPSNRLHVGPDAPTQLYIEHRNHHYNMITKINAYFSRSYWCHKCWVGTNNQGSHKCEFACSQCFQSTACSSNESPLTCQTCHRDFWGNTCFEQHKKFGVCNSMKKCSACEVEYRNKHEHKCGMYFCGKCKNHSIGQHHCFITPKNKDELMEEDRKHKIIVSFDIESELKPRGSSDLHKANLLICRIVCDDCYNSTTNIKARPNCSMCGPREIIYKGYDCVKKFSDYLYKSLARKAEKLKAKVLVFAHNFKSYDGHFIMKDLFNRDFNCIEPIMNGSKLLKIDVGNIKFMDSLSFFQQPLACLPKSFGFTDRVLKGFFPHKFNTEANWVYEGTWPAEEYYEPENMKSEAKAAFKQWYSQQTEKVFNLQEELIHYCQNDVEILEQAVMRFRTLFRETTGLDPITRCFTLPSIGLETFRANCLEENVLGITPIEGYDTHRKQSWCGKAWLDWQELNLGLQIDREVRCGPYYADGKQSKTCFEFWGCFWHGCVECHRTHRDETTLTGSSPNQLYAVVEKKRDYYRRHGYELVEIWECQFNNECETDPQLKKFYKSRVKHFAKIEQIGSVSINESFFGGRTNCVRFHHSIRNNDGILSQDEDIKYLDVTSEYPYVLKNFEYPIGHPQLIQDQFDMSLETYFGFVKCTILPPKNLYLPVLPARYHLKLEFVLCHTCATEKNQHTCTHNDSERSLTGTWTTVELKNALTKGYQIQTIYQVLDYASKSSDLFRSYINMWLKVKQEASGWPVWCKNESDKQSYLCHWQEREGFALNPSNIDVNPGKRFIAKLMLNSFWGKLSQRPNMLQTTVCKEFFQYYNLLTDDTVELEGECQVNDETLLVSWKKKSLTDCDPGNTNVAIASFVTSYARTYLYSKLEVPLRNGQDRLMYFDTDSIVFIEKKSDQFKLAVGDFLGDLTDELADYGPGARITKFVTGGPKNYAYEVLKTNGTVKVILKTKGISNNAKTLDTLNIEAVTHLVNLYTQGTQESISVPQRRFTSDKFSQIVKTSDVFKQYRVVAEKRRVLGNATLPFGFVDGLASLTI